MLVGAAAPASAWAGVRVGVLVVLYLVVIFGSIAMLVVALVDIVRRPEWQWKIAGQDKVLWIILVVLLNILAIPSLIYWFRIRKKLLLVEVAAKTGAYGPGHVTYAGWEPVPPAVWSTPPGWHPDPIGEHEYRWWDGFGWTDYTWSASSRP